MTARTSEEERLEQARLSPEILWRCRGPTSANGPGARCARTTAPTATPGTTSPTTMPAAAPTAGARTASLASATATSFWSSPSPCGTAATPSSRNGCSVWCPAKRNHGEDVKEYYFYLDSTPTHSYMKYLYKYPAGELSLRPARSSRAAARRPRAGVRTARHGHLRRGSLLRRLRRVRQGRPGRHCHPHRGLQPRAAKPASIHVLPQLWFRNTWAWGPTPGPVPRIEPGPSGNGFVSLRRPRRHHAAQPAHRIYDLGAALPVRRIGVPALFTDNETNAERIWPGTSPAAALTSRTPSTATSSTARPASTRTRSAPRPASTSPIVVVPAGDSVVFRLRLTGKALARAAGRRRCHRCQPQGRGRRVLQGAASAKGDGGRKAGAAAGPGGHALVEADLPLRRQHLAGRRQPELTAARVAPRYPQRPLAAPQFHARPVDAGQVGISLVRRLGPRLPYRPPGPGRSRVRQGAALAAALRAVPAPQRPDSRVRVGIFGPQSSGPCLGGVARLQHRSQADGAGGSALSGEVFPQAADQLRLVGQQRRFPGATTSSRAASWGWTTSPCWTAASRCRPACRSSSPTPPAGWACSAST